MIVTPAMVATALKLFGKQTPEELDAGRMIATHTVLDYGDFESHEWEKFVDNGIWNDHASVQAALATIQLFKPLIEAVRPMIEEGQRIAREVKVSRPVNDPPTVYVMYDDLAAAVRAWEELSL